MNHYLIIFDFDTQNYRDDSTDAFAKMKNILSKHGFKNIQGSVYIGNEGISEAHGTLAIQELTLRYDWFYSCVSNIKFYRLESDLEAQFIADGAHHAKQEFLQRIEQLRLSLENAGLSQDKIEEILRAQNFELNNLQLPFQN